MIPLTRMEINARYEERLREAERLHLARRHRRVARANRSANRNLLNYVTGWVGERMIAWGNWLRGFGATSMEPLTNR